MATAKDAYWQGLKATVLSAYSPASTQHPKAQDKLVHY